MGKYKKIPFDKAKEIHMKRDKPVRIRDEKRWAKDIAYDEKWSKNPQKYDYPNIDTPMTTDEEIHRRIRESEQRKQIIYARRQLEGEQKGRTWDKELENFSQKVRALYTPIRASLRNPDPKDKKLIKEKEEKISKHIINEKQIYDSKKHFRNLFRKDLKRIDNLSDRPLPEIRDKLKTMVINHLGYENAILGKERDLQAKYKTFEPTRRQKAKDYQPVETNKKLPKLKKELFEVRKKLNYRNKMYHESIAKANMYNDQLLKPDISDEEKTVLKSKTDKWIGKSEEYLKQISMYEDRHKHIQRRVKRIEGEKYGVELRRRPTVKIKPADEDRIPIKVSKLKEGMTEEELVAFDKARASYIQSGEIVYDVRFLDKHPNIKEPFLKWVDTQKRLNIKRKTPPELKSPSQTADKKSSLHPPSVMSLITTTLKRIEDKISDIKTVGIPAIGSAPTYPSYPSTPLGTYTPESDIEPSPKPKMVKGDTFRTAQGVVVTDLAEELKKKTAKLASKEEKMETMLLDNELKARENMTDEERVAFTQLIEVNKLIIRNVVENQTSQQKTIGDNALKLEENLLMKYPKLATAYLSWKERNTALNLLDKQGKILSDETTKLEKEKRAMELREVLTSPERKAREDQRKLEMKQKIEEDKKRVLKEIENKLAQASEEDKASLMKLKELREKSLKKPSEKTE